MKQLSVTCRDRFDNSKLLLVLTVSNKPADLLVTGSSPNYEPMSFPADPPIVERNTQRPNGFVPELTYW